MYSAYFLIFISAFIVLKNWIIGVSGGGIILSLMTLQIPPVHFDRKADKVMLKGAGYLKVPLFIRFSNISVLAYLVVKTICIEGVQIVKLIFSQTPSLNNLEALLLVLFNGNLAVFCPLFEVMKSVISVLHESWQDRAPNPAQAY
jgi:hypothetical protein